MRLAFRADHESGDQRKREPDEDLRPQIVNEGFPKHIDIEINAVASVRYENLIGINLIIC